MIVDLRDLTLRVDHQRPSLAAGGDDTVLRAESVTGKSLDVPVSHLRRFGHELAEVELWRVRNELRRHLVKRWIILLPVLLLAPHCCLPPPLHTVHDSRYHTVFHKSFANISTQICSLMDSWLTPRLCRDSHIRGLDFVKNIWRMTYDVWRISHEVYAPWIQIYNEHQTNLCDIKTTNKLVAWSTECSCDIKNPSLSYHHMYCVVVDWLYTSVQSVMSSTLSRIVQAWCHQWCDPWWRQMSYIQAAWYRTSSIHLVLLSSSL